MATRAFSRRKAPGVLAAGFAILVLVACSPSQSQDEQAAASASVSAPAKPASASGPAISSTVAPSASDSDDAVIERVSTVIKKHRLTTLQEACLEYLVDDSDGATVDVDVHEKHDASCGGDPETSPRLFSFKLDRASGQLTTDAMDLADGDFQPIK
jgi:hypothetical protein